MIGPKDQLDTVTRQYLCRYEIQLENAMGELKHLNNITPNAELNYREAAGRAAEIADALWKQSNGSERHGCGYSHGTDH